MNISLTKELDRYIHSKVDSGRYTSASEVVREALRLMQDRETAQSRRTGDIRQAIQEGIEDLDNRRYIEGTAEELLAMTLKGARENLAAKTKKARAS